MNFCRLCGVDTDVNKNRRSLSTNDRFHSILTDIAVRCCEGTSRSHLDIQKFQDGYLCRPCFREVERLSLQESQVRDLRGAIESKLSQQIHRFVSVGTEASATDDQETRQASSRPSRKRPRPASKTVSSVSNESPDVAVSLL